MQKKLERREGHFNVIQECLVIHVNPRGRSDELFVDIAGVCKNPKNVARLEDQMETDEHVRYRQPMLRSDLLDNARWQGRQKGRRRRRFHRDGQIGTDVVGNPGHRVTFKCFGSSFNDENSPIESLSNFQWSCDCLAIHFAMAFFQPSWIKLQVIGCCFWGFLWDLHSASSKKDAYLRFQTEGNCSTRKPKSHNFSCFDSFSCWIISNLPSLKEIHLSKLSKQPSADQFQFH